MAKISKRAGRPEGSNRAETRQNLLLSARRCFANKGLDATTFKDVALCVGVTPAAIYQYYDSKMSLYSATLDSTLEVLLPQYFKAIENNQTLKEKIKSILKTSIRVHSIDKISTTFLVSIPIELQRHPDLHDFLGFDRSGIVASLMSMFKDAQEKGEIRNNVNVEGLMLTIMGAVIGITLFQDGFKVGSAEHGINTLIDMTDNYLT